MLNRMPSVEKNLKQITKVNDREREIADTENKGRERKSVDVAARRSESESEREREREGERERLRSIAMYSLVLGESPRLPPPSHLVLRSLQSLHHRRRRLSSSRSFSRSSLSPPPPPCRRSVLSSSRSLRPLSRHAFEIARRVCDCAFRQSRHFGQFWLRANRLRG